MLRYSLRMKFIFFSCQNSHLRQNKLFIYSYFDHLIDLNALMLWFYVSTYFQFNLRTLFQPKNLFYVPFGTTKLQFRSKIVDKDWSWFKIYNLHNFFFKFFHRFAKWLPTKKSPDICTSLATRYLWDLQSIFFAFHFENLFFQ